MNYYINIILTNIKYEVDNLTGKSKKGSLRMKKPVNSDIGLNELNILKELNAYLLNWLEN